MSTKSARILKLMNIRINDLIEKHISSLIN